MIHGVFDMLAAAAAAGVTWVLHRRRLSEAATRIDRAGPGYAVALVAGAVLGGFGAGTLNLRLAGLPGIGRSILGALLGAIVAIELYKRIRGIRGSTGLLFVPGFTTSVIVGRWGCFLAGLGDRTYGIPTSLPWGYDFGDGIARHPVQLYESASMTLLLVVELWLLRGRSPLFLRKGFYLMVLGYSAQRFVWEFLKPYPTLAGPFNLFHLICAALLVYSGVMLRRVDGSAAP